MTHFQIALCCAFAASLALGQILFKLAAASWNANASGSANSSLSFLSPYLVLAAIAYSGTAILWVYILRSVPLSRAYVFSILGSALVPIAAFLIFKEPVTAKYAWGFGLVLIGVALCVS